MPCASSASKRPRRTKSRRTARVGAFLGGWLFGQLGVNTPFGGLAGTIFVAFIGAVVLLFLLRLISRGRRKV
ncbi:MAG: GlsB/YeaQ/YmgE family stress response membrane protein [Gemmatimonadaceae bacterium]|nr:GlsB/YeaQ/YmgE family stress response membrane protein [Gemmatimonadaceae bacterium]